MTPKYSEPISQINLLKSCAALGIIIRNFDKLTNDKLYFLEFDDKCSYLAIESNKFLMDNNLSKNKNTESITYSKIMEVMMMLLPESSDEVWIDSNYQLCMRFN